MALAVKTLTDAFRGFASSPPLTLDSASQLWAQAYHTYALSSQALDSTPIVALTAKTSLALQNRFASSMQKQVFLLDMPINLSAYWADISFVGINNGSVATVGGVPALTAAIVNIMKANGRGNGSLDPLAIAIDAFTRTVIVNLVSPAGVPIPTPIL